MKKNETNVKNDKRVLGRVLAKEVSKAELKAAMGGATALVSGNCADEAVDCFSD